MSTVSAWNRRIRWAEIGDQLLHRHAVAAGEHQGMARAGQLPAQWRAHAARRARHQISPHRLPSRA
jgi:hypothetical protein